MRASAPANVAAHISTLIHEAFRDTHSKAGLSRRSAVVRGAVDTGCRRNNNRRGLEEENMNRFRMLLFAVVGILMSGMTVFAQAVGEAGDNASSVSKYRALAAGVGPHPRPTLRRVSPQPVARD